VALKLRDVLEKDGVEVIMVRTTDKVDITNSQRAEIANKAHADLFIRLRCDGSSSHSVHGISVLTPGKNKWTGPIVAPSMVAAKLVSRDAIKATKAKNRGIVRRTDLAGFNWCKVPTVLVEMGFMTNAKEDRRLAKSAYQHKLAAGMAQGILDYLSARDGA
jgi:N-acetylmuramoyl-L-alanine amidase